MAELKALQAQGIQTVISDPVRNRHLEKLVPEDVKMIRNVRRSADSKSGKELLPPRGLHIERRFAHVLEVGGCGQVTSGTAMKILPGWEVVQVIVLE